MAAVAALRPSTPCPRCGTAFVQHAGWGARRIYCSTSCRRAVEFEIRRANRHLEGAERRLQAQRDRVVEIESGVGGLGTLANARQQLDFARRRVGELTARLEELLAPGQLTEKEGGVTWRPPPGGSMNP